MATNTQTADNDSASTDESPSTQPVPQSWVKYGNTDYLETSTPFFATTITHVPSLPSGEPLESDRYERAGKLRVRFVNLERDVALPVVEDAVRDTHTGTISPRVIYDRGVEAWDAVITGEWTTRDGPTPTELDREVLVTVWNDVAGDVGEMVGQE